MQECIKKVKERVPLFFVLFWGGFFQYANIYLVILFNFQEEKI